MGATPAILVRRLHKHFGSLHALQGVDLEVRQGEFFALLGPNGAGKTTLISILAGLTRASSGSAAVMGHDVVRDYRATRKALGVVPQELVYDPFFTVREGLRIQSGYFGLRRNDDWIDEVMANLDLLDKADRNMRTLSGGMKRRVLVAQALVHKPPVMILDEPTAGVDVELRQSLWAFIRKLNEGGHTIVLTTHYLEEAQALCNRVAMLKQGRIVALDSTANLLNSIAERHLRIRITPDALPAGLAARVVSHIDGLHVLALDHYADLEGVLAQLRQAGVCIQEMELTQPDLEDVFVRIMGAS
ncbi:ABC transporter ATP-binding subunit [Sulfuriferula plumbiphila]|uniref:ABC transporter ATP-binding subunit n=1 Tax=Sulfuriferula plumbiphila TaxID=171865 RepID=A0A512L9L2_9PROT|nr:ABC transporter ATP-binding protein [Sulfuriferula plumbiphila]BBP03666.1 ABC transporter ATP-binding subunit [Sulfuriferula plumbiphila]GEP31176.1 ABC transporter ATP-binding subunit [Sulfuriferula plumbiphila]